MKLITPYFIINTKEIPKDLIQVPIEIFGVIKAHYGVIPVDANSLLMFDKVLDFYPGSKKDINNINYSEFQKRYPITENYIYEVEEGDNYPWIEEWMSDELKSLIIKRTKQGSITKSLNNHLSGLFTWKHTCENFDFWYNVFCSKLQEIPSQFIKQQKSKKKNESRLQEEEIDFSGREEFKGSAITYKKSKSSITSRPLSYRRILGKIYK